MRARVGRGDDAAMHARYTIRSERKQRASPHSFSHYCAFTALRTVLRYPNGKRREIQKIKSPLPIATLPEEAKQARSTSRLVLPARQKKSRSRCKHYAQCSAQMRRLWRNTGLRPVTQVLPWENTRFVLIVAQVGQEAPSGDSGWP